ncbi:hypothetical protein Tco_0360627 [Tanacetum coccineum]
MNNQHPLQDIPIGQLYRTHPGGPCRALTARNSVRPLHSHCLALRSFFIGAFTSRFITSSGHSTLGHSLSGRTPSVTTIAVSSKPSRFIYPPPTRTLRGSKAYRRWPSESLDGDSSFESSVGTSRKRCRSPATTVRLSIPASRALVPTRADLLPPSKSNYGVLGES